MAYSIDDTMDRFEQSYNQYNLINYRKSLVSQATGKVLLKLLIDFGGVCGVESKFEVL